MSKATMNIPLVDLVAQYKSIQQEMDTAIAGVIGSGRFIGGADVARFAQQFSAYCRTEYTVPCANGTDAVEIALTSLGIGKGDEVILPAFTFYATLEAVWNTGAKPVLCDIDADRYTIDPYKAIDLVTPATKAIIPVHLYGQMADMDPMVGYALDHHMYIIEDAAQAHGALYKGMRAGSIGDINTFSFYPGKNLGAYGDAGALTTKSQFLYEKALKIANHGRSAKYDHDSIGRNSRLDSIQAAILNVKLKHIENWTSARQSLADRYHQRLSGHGDVQLPHIYTDSPCVYHLFVIRVHADIRESLREHLRAVGIETGIHYPFSLSKLKATTDVMHIQANCPVAEKVSQEVLSLPLYPEMTGEMVDYICEAVTGFFKI